jgi:hypothetical protein
MIDACLTTPALIAAVVSAAVAAWMQVGKLFGKLLPNAGNRQRSSSPGFLAPLLESPVRAVSDGIKQPWYRQSGRLTASVAAVFLCGFSIWLWWASTHVPYLVSVEVWRAGGNMGDDSELAMVESEAFPVSCGCRLPDDRLQPAVVYLTDWLETQEGEVNVGIRAFDGEKNDIVTSLKRMLIDSINRPNIHIRPVEDIDKALKANEGISSVNPVFRSVLQQSLEIHVLILGTYVRR